ncbi:Pre-mRNA-splicing factor SYF1, partial [Bonamia ostreae]
TRDVYEEGVNSVNTVRDFEYIFNTYCQFFEIMIRAKFERGETDDEDEGDFSFAGDNVDLLMARYEDLLKRRPLLVNSVLIRQNPHNVGCWLSRAKIYQRQEEPLKVIESYAMAIKTINPDKCRGNPHMLWIKLAKFYEDNSDDLDNVRKTFERAVMYPFKNVDHLATVWCTWAETEISHKNYEKALEVIKMATMLPHKKARFEEKSVGDRLVAQKRVYRSPKLWALYADLEENLGTFETTCAVYETAMELRVATVQMILNFSTFLEKKKYFEKAFQTYEKGVALFRTPHSIPIWERYISKFVARYGGTKIDRTRSIFEYAVKSFRAVEAKDILVKYANFEEKYGTPKKAMAVFDKMCDLLRGKDKYEAFLVYLNKATEAFGAIMTRSIYEKAVKVLPDAFVPHICIRFANLETRLGEVDRARAVFRYS